MRTYNLKDIVHIAGVDHPESITVHPQGIFISWGANGASRIAKEYIFVSPDHIVRIEPAKRRPLRKTRRKQ